MKRRKLYRNAGRLINVVLAARAAERLDCMLISIHVTGGIWFGERGLAQHIEGIEKTALFQGPGVFQRFLDRLAGHELPSEKPYGKVHRFADDGLAPAGQGAAQRGRHSLLAACADKLACDQ